MSLLPTVNSGVYKIVHFAYGPIRDDDGALGAVGKSSSPELEWMVIRNADHTYSFNVFEGTKGIVGAASHPGGAISEVKKRYYVSLEAPMQETHWRLQPVLFGSEPRILYAIYQDPRDNPGQCDLKGHWELNSSDKKEPVKLNRDPADEENKAVPASYGAPALWILQPVTVPLSTPNPPSSY
ncbi:hypothetical protein FRC19_001610 [Serendipita sp. 401]|nr:hypothetical protein FRC15_003328 [Serendipita sp. 397]KAG8776261.1 hypothetical protein FRC16_004575 [Serendipita sp. 398]KAG8814632.1 hypothetical protein FRC19_001610 [Serendipita sp. 401]KAG8817731.1 hypothetical protein FRC18_000371 [Serendipita sp. 400]